MALAKAPWLGERSRSAGGIIPRSTPYLASMILLVVLALSAGNAAARSLPMDRAASEIQRELSQRFGCPFQGTADSVSCFPADFDGSLGLYVDRTDQTVETVEMNPLVAARPRRPDVEKINRETAIRIVQYLLPTWSDARRWLTKALDDVTRARVKHETKVDKISVFVGPLQPADLEASYAWVVLTKRPSLAQWDTD
jgi:hypothetical protein